LSFVKFYDLNGITIRVTAPDEALGVCLDPLLGPLAVPGPLDAQWSVDIRLDDALPAEVPGQTIWDGNMLEGLAAIFREEAGRTRSHLLVHDHLVVSADRNRRHIGVTVRPGREKALHASPSIKIISEIIAASGLHLIHAACLLFPSQEEALVIFAPSGTGKTTTSLALARTGWRLFGDDATLLELDGGSPRVWALPRGLNVHQRTVQMLPWLSPAMKPWRDREEQGVALETIAPLITVARGPGRACRNIVVLDRPNETGHVIVPIDRTEALLRIMSDNMRVAPGGLGDQDVSMFSTLADLVKDANMLRVSVGPDPATLGPELVAACGRNA
jgi:hypothetical protein